MGQKVNPVGFRLGVNRGWDSVWYAKKKDFGNYLIEDFKIRDLQFSAKRITKDIRKTISSAVANAENNFQYDIDSLIVKEAYCGKKITMKRFRPRAKGRAASILKPYSSVTIILSEAKKMESHGTKS